MTSILVLEDQTPKADSICQVIDQSLSGETDILRVTDFATFSNVVNTQRFDLIVLDLVVPRFSSGEALDITEEVVALIRQNTINSKATYVAITQFDDLIATRGREFATLGIATVEYSADDRWKSALRVSVQRAYRYQENAFIILCALPLERSALQHTNAEVGQLINRNGLNCLSVKVGEHRGAAILLPRMGLVEAAILSAKAIETFRPKLVSMIGICAGFTNRAELGTILFADPIWEHQSGKWLSDSFTLESYQEPMRATVRTIIEQEIERTQDFKELKKDLETTGEAEFLNASAKISPMVSGSTVVASGELQKLISSQHPRLAGLDMETFGVYRSASKAHANIDFFGVKVVVDFADEKKEDRYQKLGAIISARVATHLIPLLLTVPR